MKLKDFQKYFTKIFQTTLVTTKKPTATFKSYLLFSRLGSYYCLDFVQFFTLLKSLVFFLQTAVAAATPITFFFEALSLASIYAELSKACNSLAVFTPRAFCWLSSWAPVIRETSLAATEPGRMSLVSDYTRYSSSISLLFNPSALFIPSVLVKNAWPLILCTNITAPITSQSNQLFSSSIYLLPSSGVQSAATSYFLAAFFSRTILFEKLRAQS